ncbi:unnamed protein product [Prorocentrum cordatum]|uniref:Uncharacterized protein n=1 Tax=Prorocentrum cordatum TaxID=2364126 RepID=A0ABN9Y121_9DINO|nr:unnamed protein product [Polarella glacialis]
MAAAAVVAEEAGQSAPSPFSDATDATIDAAGAMAPDTEPASPASTSGGAFDDFGASGSHRLASRVSAEELLAASEGLAAASGDVRGAPRRRDGEDGLPSARHPADAGADMSSSSYFGTHVKRPPPATDRAAPERGAAAQRASPALVQDPFPKAREAVLMDRLADASHEVWGLRSAVGEAMGRTQVRPLEVQQILQAAEGVLARTRLSEAELEQVGWPSQAIRQMRDALSCLEVWERCEEGAKQAIANEQAALPALTGALEQVMAGWCQLCRLQGGALRLDVGLERRATSAGPMVSALLDKAMGLLRGAPDVVAARRLEALLQRGTRQRELQGFSVAIGAAQHLQEIGDLASGISAEAVGSRPGQARGARLAVPELLWKAVMDGDSRTVQAVIQHGGLVSGRAEDPQGHTVFWDALAFQRVDVALLLLRHFPPGTSYGVCLGEQHQRSGNSLLHLAAGLANFTSNAEALFAALFDQVPDGLKAHRNKRGQTIAHTAASRPNFWVLRFLAARSFDSLLVAEDNEGLTPCQMLESAMDSLGVPDLLQPLDASASRMPSWCPLRSFQPLAAGQRPPLSDAVVTVDDAARGRVDFHVHPSSWPRAPPCGTGCCSAQRCQMVREARAVPSCWRWTTSSAAAPRWRCSPCASCTRETRTAPSGATRACCCSCCASARRVGCRRPCPRWRWTRCASTSTCPRWRGSCCARSSPRARPGCTCLCRTARTSPAASSAGTPSGRLRRRTTARGSSRRPSPRWSRRGRRARSATRGRRPRRPLPWLPAAS